MAVETYVGSRVRLRRTLLGMSQEHLGERLGLTFQQVQKYEKGANRISAGTLYQLSQILDVPVAFFYDGFEDGSAEAASESADGSMTGEVAAADRDGVDPMKDRRVLRLIRNWRSVPPKVQDEVMSLLSALCGDSEGSGESAPRTGWGSSAEAGDDSAATSGESALRASQRRRRRGAIWDPADIKSAGSPRKV